MIPDFSGDYLNYDGTQDGDMFVILSEGKVEYNETLKKEMFNIEVEHNKKKKVWSPSNKHGKLLQDAFGLDTKTWLNRKVQVIHVDKKMAIRPIKEVKV